MILVRVFVLVTILSWAAFGATFGATIPLLGEFSDLALDEGRGLLYIANFTANRIEVFSTVSQGFQPPIRVGINPSAVALAPDGKTLMVLNFCSASLFMVNLDNRSIQTVSLPGFPRAGEFGSDGAVIIVAGPVNPCNPERPAQPAQVLRYDPASGELKALQSFDDLFGGLPVPQPRFPAEILNAKIAASRDRSTLFAAVQLNSFPFSFAFYYYVPTGSLLFRCVPPPDRQPVRFPPIASISPDGSRAMGGQVVFDSKLRVLGDFTPFGALPIKVAPAVPTAPAPNAPPPAPNRVIGGTVFGRDGGTIYASLVDPQGAGAAPFLYLLDSDNLTVRDRILVPDRLTGKMISNAAGTRLYALSDSGLTILPISDLDRAPRLTTSADVVSFKFNVCSKQSTAVTFNVANRGSGSVAFQVSSDMPGVQISPSAGTTPATVTVTFDPDKLFNVKGTATGLINISSPDAVNIPNPVRVLVNLQDSDQRGTIFVQGGTLRDLLVDEPRQRFYMLDSAGTANRLLVFDLNDFSLRATVRTGYFPLNMTIAQDRRTLLVTNAQSETISRINLDTLQPEGFAFCPCGSYPRSIAVSSNAVLLTTAVDRPLVLRTADNQQVQVIVTEGRMNRVDLANSVANEMATMGIFENKLSPKTLLTATPNGSRILIAEDSGTTGALAKIYEADSDTFVVARAVSSKPLKGGAAATDNGLYNAGPVLMGPSLTPLAEFSDAPNEHNGLVFVGNQIVRTLKPATAGGPGIISRVDPATLRSLNPVKLAEAPLAFLDDQPLRRSLAATRDGGKFVTLSSSGFMIITGSFDAFIPPPAIRLVTNSATFQAPVAPGALISVFGDNLAPLSTRAGAVPLPTFLADSCITVNNLPVPLLFLSPGQINAQIPFEVTGSATMVIHTSGGVSDPFNFDVPGAAPALFRSSFGGQAPQPIPLIFRAANGEPVTVSNAARQGEVLFMFANGLGRVMPAVASGDAPPPGPLFQTVLTPTVTVGDRAAEVLFSGLAPGFVGLNQLNIRVPLDAPLGFDIPLKIAAAGNAADVTLARVLPALEK